MSENLAPLPTPLVELIGFGEREVQVYMKLDHLTHPILSGNKYRKLKYNITALQENNLAGLLTFGGAYSNHIAATAAAGKIYNFKTIGIIRGEQPKVFGWTLQLAIQYGMKLIFMPRAEFDDPLIRKSFLINSFADYLIVPEGGSNELGIIGASEIPKEILSQSEFHVNYITCAMGTGGTALGIAKSLQPKQRIIGFSALNPEKIEYLPQFVAEQGIVISESAGKGYARTTQDQMDFINVFYDRYQIPLDPIYTSKMMMSLHSMIRSNYFKPGNRIVAIHTGGLQAWGGMMHKIPANEALRQVILSTLNTNKLSQYQQVTD